IDFSLLRRRLFLFCFSLGTGSCGFGVFHHLSGLTFIGLFLSFPQSNLTNLLSFNTLTFGFSPLCLTNLTFLFFLFLANNSFLCTTLIIYLPLFLCRFTTD